MNFGIARALARWLTRNRDERALRVVDQAPLYGAAVVHVVDVGRHRLVFATSPSAICLLAQFENTPAHVHREEAASHIADTTM